MDTSIQIQEHVKLAPFTTLRIGGPARYFVRAETERDVIEAFQFASANNLKTFVLGGGSNILVADAGFDGLVVQMAIRGISDIPPDFTSRVIVIKASAGDNWDAFVQHCVEHDLAGIECLSGIPGFVGGTPVQNVGAYGQEVSNPIGLVQCFDRLSGEIVNLANQDCGFAYRTSIFNSTARDRYVVLAVFFYLQPGGEPKIVYKDLVETFRGMRPTLKEVREAVLSIRMAKSMVIDASDPNSRSAGSFFKNPIISNEKYIQILESFGGHVPKFAADGDNVKIPAAWLIENSGFHKGYRLGNAGISTKHTLAIVNCGGATAKEVIDLKGSIQNAVESKFGILLQSEPIFVGF
ncbi:MAG: UDP-N-acetylmuramate dehydrogenase [Acidobacteriota bacterium]